MKNKNISRFSLTMSRIPFWVLTGEWIHISGNSHRYYMRSTPTRIRMNFKFKKDAIVSFAESEFIFDEPSGTYTIFITINDTEIQLTMCAINQKSFKDELIGLKKLIGCA